MRLRFPPRPSVRPEQAAQEWQAWLSGRARPSPAEPGRAMNQHHFPDCNRFATSFTGAQKPFRPSGTPPSGISKGSTEQGTVPTSRASAYAEDLKRISYRSTKQTIAPTASLFTCYQAFSIASKRPGMLCSNNFPGTAREDQHDETSQSLWYANNRCAVRKYCTLPECLQKKETKIVRLSRQITPDRGLNFN